MLGILGGIKGTCQGLASPGKRDTGDCASLGWGEDAGDTGGEYWRDARPWHALGWGEDGRDTGGMPGSGMPWDGERMLRLLGGILGGYRGLGSSGMGRGCCAPTLCILGDDCQHAAFVREPNEGDTRYGGVGEAAP